MQKNKKNEKKSKRKGSLVWEMMLFISLTIVVAGIIVIAVYMFSNSYRQRNSIERTVSIILEDYYATNLTLDGVDEEMRKGPYSRTIYPLRKKFFVCDPRGYILYPGIPPGRHGRKRDELFIPRRVDKRQLENGIPFYYEKDIIGYIFIAPLPFHKIEVTLIVIGAVILLTVPICGIFIKQKLKPLDRVLKGAATIGNGDYSVRISPGGAGEIAQLIDQFNGMAQSIEDSDNWKKQIVSDTAHELRTPITLLLSRLEMMADGIYPVDNSSIVELQEDLTRLSDLVSNIQRLSSLESSLDSSLKSKENSDVISIPLFSLVQSFVNKFDLPAKDKGVKLSLSSGCEDIVVLGDLLEIEQVLVNLLSNAIDFTPENGEIKISLEAKDNNFLSLKVEDSGPGISLAERERVFERFYRIDKSRNRKYGGSGLGLTISKIIVEKHGGSILLGDSSLEGGGLCVEVLLPVKAENC